MSRRCLSCGWVQYSTEAERSSTYLHGRAADRSGDAVCKDRLCTTWRKFTLGISHDLIAISSSFIPQADTMSLSESPRKSSSPTTSRSQTLARSNTSPTLNAGYDIESQQDIKWIRPRGFKRASTVSTFRSSITELKTLPERQRAFFSQQDVVQSPQEERPQLERTETWVVEEEASHGYPKLASLLGGTEGYAIYKRFASLNARNLLYHQAKLIHLEHELNEMEKELAHDSDLHYSVHHIFHAEPGTRRDELRKKHEEVSRALDKYNSLLLDQKRLHDLPSPDSTFVDSIHNYINNVKAPRPGWLDHPEKTIYAVWDDDRKPVQPDLVTLNRNFRTQDAFTGFFTGRILQWWHYFYKRMKKPDDELDGYIYTEGAMSRYMRAVIMIVASALPTCSIVALYFIRDEIHRLVFIILFSMLFSGALAFFTEAKRVEVFAASVALASVQVVFVGTAFGNNVGENVGNG